MADDPSSKADERLRAYAKKRRSGMGADFQMPPATRRALQAEVARQFPDEKDDSRDATASFWGFWPRFAVGMAFLGLVLVGSFMGWRQERAKTTVQTPAVAQEQVRLARAKETLPDTSIPALKQKTDAAESNASASAPVSLVFSLASDSSADMASLVEAGQHFTRVNMPATLRKNFNSPPAPAILTSFQVNRDGDRIAFTDSDGSTYRGHAVALSSSDATNAVVQFEATGTNLTLKATVTLAGTMSPAGTPLPSQSYPEQASTRIQTLAVGENESLTRTASTEQIQQRGFQEKSELAQKAAATAIASPPPPSAQIRATVVIGGQTRFELIANQPPKTN